MRKGLLPLVVAFVAVFAFACLAQAKEAQGTQGNQSASPKKSLCRYAC